MTVLRMTTKGQNVGTGPLFPKIAEIILPLVSI